MNKSGGAPDDRKIILKGVAAMWHLFTILVTSIGILTNGC